MGTLGVTIGIIGQRVLASRHQKVIYTQVQNLNSTRTRPTLNSEPSTLNPKQILDVAVEDLLKQNDPEGLAYRMLRSLRFQV